MKTRTTFLAALSMLLIVFTANAGPQTSKLNKLRSLQQQKTSSGTGITGSPLNHLYLNNDQFSVPGNSDDYTWNPETSSWIHTSKSTYKYDDTGKQLEEVVQDAETGLYLTKESQKYDDKGNVTEEISYMSINDEWMILSGTKTQYAYNEHGYLNEETEHIWNNGVWENKSKNYYTLNGNGIPTEIHASVWDGANWIDYSRTVLLVWHDWSKKQLSGYTIQYWQDGMNDERYTAIYDGDNYTATTEVQKNGQWVNSKRDTYTHSSTEDVNISEIWENSDWKKVEKYISTFDGFGNPTGFQYSSWGDNDWFLEVRYFFDLAYDDQNNLTEMTIRYWDPELEAPENVLKSVFSNFLHFTTDVSDLETLSNFKAFPNPVNDALNLSVGDAKVKSYQVSITNLSGQTVYQDTFFDRSVEINTEKLTRGIYVLSIKTEDGKSRQSKILKQ